MKIRMLMLCALLTSSSAIFAQTPDSCELTVKMANQRLCFLKASL